MQKKSKQVHIEEKKMPEYPAFLQNDLCKLLCKQPSTKYLIYIKKKKK